MDEKLTRIDMQRTLSAPQLRVIDLIEQGYSQDEIAAIMGITRGMVRGKLKKAQHKLNEIKKARRFNRA